MENIMARPFNFRMPREVIFEAGCSALAAEKAAALGAKRPVFITGRSMAKSAALAALLDSAKSAGMTPSHWGEVEPEPPAELLYRAAADIRALGGDCLIALGGGSSMDFAKMAAVLAKYPDMDIAAMVGSERVPARGLPTLMIPTTAGSGSEVSAVAVFSFPEEKTKKGVASGNIVADAALVDPLLTLGLPAHITAAAGMDALVHAVESYLSLGTNPLTRDLALAAIEKIVPNLAACVREPGNVGARTAQAYGSLTAGMAFAMSGTAGVHAMAYPLGGEFHIPHGEANTAMLRWVMEYNLEGCPEKFVPIAKAMKINTTGMSAGEAASASLEAMIALGAECGVKTRLRDFNIPRGACQRMAAAAMKETRLINNNPRKLTEEAVREIYERAW
ncbi:MAG: iron-containing alcohol dehydrogenase [Synergistaceae bacterium]|nr:iron-containing alcohol dehydrogenase [Synergistaceae bacterium]